jgi:hypothetical protein
MAADGILEVVPVESDVYFEFDGHRYRLGMLSIEDWAMFADQVRKMRPDPIAVAREMIEGLERENQVEVLKWAWTEARRAQIVPESEVYSWSMTPIGSSFMFWRSLLHYTPTLTLDVVRGWIKPYIEAGSGRSHREIVELLDQVHALPPQGPT